jgi:hypothetical protein
MACDQDLRAAVGDDLCVQARMEIHLASHPGSPSVEDQVVQAAVVEPLSGSSTMLAPTATNPDPAGAAAAH